MSDDTRAIKEFVVREFAPDVAAEELESDYDLLRNGVIDSIGMLRTIVWLEETFEVSLEDATPDDLRSVDAIDALVTRVREPAGSTRS